MTRSEIRTIAAVVIALAIVASSAYIYLQVGRSATPSVQPPPSTPPSLPPPPPSACPNSVGLCIERNVTRVIDGDTLVVEINFRIRLVLVDAPEANETGGPQSTDYLTTLCIGQRALVDEDDRQIGADPFGRVLAVVYCNGTNANAAMISSGLARTYYAFCSSSEFGALAWTGCSSPPPPPPGNCDPAYPDVCIPPPPPDLDCADIPYRKFRVLPPDPHHFDGDGDGIGCEG